MIWHIRFDDFEDFLKRIGFRLAAQSKTQCLYMRGTDRVIVRRSPTLTQAEVDAICDDAGLHPPPFDSFFGN